MSCGYVFPVDFPSSPEELKRTKGAFMPIEAVRRRSEDDEDTSIYQALVMSNCLDVKLIKGK